MVPWPLIAFPAPPGASEVPEARIELGRLLFYDPVLSIDELTACATCHSDKWGMSDGLERSVGHGAGPVAGPQRHGENVGRRNSPALFNLAFRSTFMWDGRAASLEEQAMMPLRAPNELAIDPALVVDKLAGIEAYVQLFEAAFPDDPQVSVENMSSALAAMERTIVSKRSLYDAYVNGDPGALTQDAIEGMFRFGEQGCPQCHAPPLFESEAFANRHVPGVEGIGDDGLAEVSGDHRDRGKFRTPSLRNIAFTSPYFHNGSVWAIEDAVRHELEEGGRAYTEEDVALISRFISKSLNDERGKPERPRTVPSGLPTPIDTGT